MLLVVDGAIVSHDATNQIFLTPFVQSDGDDMIQYNTPSNVIDSGHVIAIGGYGDDTFSVSHASSVILGDFALNILFRDDAFDTRIGYQLISTWATSTGLPNGRSCKDRIMIGSNPSTTLIIGGADHDYIGLSSSIATDYLSSTMLICGDDCTFNLDTSGVATTFGSQTAIIPAGDDIIDLRMARNAIVFGNAGNDNITTGSNTDIICGDNCFASFSTSIGGLQCYLGSPLPMFMIPSVASFSDSTTTRGGNDVIWAGDGNDLVIGGIGNDTIYLENGDDVAFGDLASFTLSATISYFSLSTVLPLGTATNDVLVGGNGDDVIVGGQGDDRLYGGNGFDDLIGGHLATGLPDGNDFIEGGDSDDVIVGDNARVTRTLLTAATPLPACYQWWSTAPPLWRQYQDTNGTSFGPLRSITLYDSINDGISQGNDELHGGNGDDRLFGQRGNDIIYGDDGDDECIGGLGDDQIFGGNGRDVLLGDIAQTQRYRASNGDQRWTYQLLLEEIGSITSSSSLNPAQLNKYGWPTSDFFNKVDQLIIGGLVFADGQKVMPFNESWLILCCPPNKSCSPLVSQMVLFGYEIGKYMHYQFNWNPVGMINCMAGMVTIFSWVNGVMINSAVIMGMIFL
jgi:Ca2+-binding RTX toxin-like protein